MQSNHQKQKRHLKPAGSTRAAPRQQDPACFRRKLSGGHPSSQLIVRFEKEFLDSILAPNPNRTEVDLEKGCPTPLSKQSRN